MPGRRALVIAPLYNSKMFPPLPGGGELTQRLTDCLGQQGQYEVKVVKGTVKRSDLRREVRILCETSGEVLLYFYGHGALRDQQIGVLVTSDAEQDDEGVLMSEIVSKSYRSDAREVVLILDCCHAGAAASVSEEAIRSAVESSGAGRVLLAGCAAHQEG
jgi:Caspase domain